MKNRFSPLTLKHLTLKNRVVVPPMASETADIHGYVTSKTIEHYANLASAGASVLMVEYTYIHQSGRSEENQLGISSNEHIPGLTQIADLIKEQGSIAGIQLTHAGGKTNTSLTDGSLKTASNIPVPVKDQQMEIPEAMNLNDIRDWKIWFVEAAQRAYQAGFDLIELHAAHGYGLNQWLSPLTNNRTDEYGGAIENNSRLLFEIVAEIKSQLPKVLISVRMPGQDFLPGGLTADDCVVIARKLEKLGVDIINVSSGIGGWRRPRQREGQGYLVDEAKYIQKGISAPVIGVGGIESGLYIDQQIQAEHISLAAVGRAILKDPRQWGLENLRSHHA